MALPGITIPNKPINLAQLATEMQAAGLPVPMLGTNTIENKLFTYNVFGVPIDLPSGYQAVIDAHVPVAPVDYGGDATNLADIEAVRQYVTLSTPFMSGTPTQADAVAQIRRNVRAIKAIIRRLT